MSVQRLKYDSVFRRYAEQLSDEYGRPEISCNSEICLLVTFGGKAHLRVSPSS
jgi:hypothetical protein